MTHKVWTLESGRTLSRGGRAMAIINTVSAKEVSSAKLTADETTALALKIVALLNNAERSK